MAPFHDNFSNVSLHKILVTVLLGYGSLIMEYNEVS